MAAPDRVARTVAQIRTFVVLERPAARASVAAVVSATVVSGAIQPAFRSAVLSGPVFA